MSNRMKNVTKLILAIAICLFFCTQNASAQTPSVKTFIDKQGILIGEHIQYKVVVTASTGSGITNWFVIPDSMPHFELVDKTKIDTTTENGNTIFQQTLILTSFDSGKWSTPAFEITTAPVTGSKPLRVYTDSFAVNVGYAAADTTNELRDIKPIMDVNVKSYLWYYIGVGILLALLTAILLWRYFKGRKEQPVLEFKGKLSPYDEAMQELEKLKTLNIEQPEDIKQFHFKLASIFKWYISRKQQLSVMNKTTGDVLVHLAENKLPKENMTLASTALRMGDAVKFAKYIPSSTETNECFNNIKEVVQFIHSPKAN